MEKTINNKIENHLIEFKNELKSWLAEQNAQIVVSTGINITNITSDFLQYMFDYNGLHFNKEDLQKKKRVKNLVPTNSRCIAKRANGEQCTRHKKNDEKLCGTHVKGIPHGVLSESIVIEDQSSKIEIWVQEIKGIVYYIDNENNVYKHEDIISNKRNPEVIAKWSINNEGQYKIPDFGI